jgi:hypothetical protein
MPPLTVETKKSEMTFGHLWHLLNPHNRFRKDGPNPSRQASTARLQGLHLHVVPRMKEKEEQGGQ